jgi:hypothetical protein
MHRPGRDPIRRRRRDRVSIILDRPWRLVVFFGALILLVLLAVLIRIAG